MQGSLSCALTHSSIHLSIHSLIHSQIHHVTHPLIHSHMLHYLTSTQKNLTSPEGPQEAEPARPGARLAGHSGDRIRPAQGRNSTSLSWSPALFLHSVGAPQGFRLCAPVRTDAVQMCAVRTKEPQV